MADVNKSKNKARAKRKLRSKKKMFGTPEVPRVSVYKSLNHIYVQLVDDQSQKSLLGCSSLAASMKTEKGTKSELATKVGELFAAKAKEKGFEAVVFDRSGYRYHGRVKALADGARKGGLKF